MAKIVRSHSLTHEGGTKFYEIYMVSHGDKGCVVAHYGPAMRRSSDIDDASMCCSVKVYTVPGNDAFAALTKGGLLLKEKTSSRGGYSADAGQKISVGCEIDHLKTRLMNMGMSGTNATLVFNALQGGDDVIWESAPHEAKPAMATTTEDNPMFGTW